MAFVRQIAERLAGTDDLGVVVRIAARTAADAVGAEHVTVHVVDPHAAALVPVAVEWRRDGWSSSEASTATLAMGALTAAAMVVRRGEPAFWSTSAERDRRYPELAAQPESGLSWAILPMVVRGAGVGAVSFGFHLGRRLGSADAGFLEVVVDQCAEAVERVQAGSALRLRRDTSVLLREGMQLMVSTVDPALVVERLVHLAVPRLAPWCAVYVAEGAVLRRVAVEIHGRPDLAETLRGLPAVAIEEPTVLGDVYSSGEAQVVSVVGEALIRQLYAGTQVTALREAVEGKTSLVVPVEASGEMVGVMTFVSGAWHGSPPREVVEVAEGLAAKAGMALLSARRLADEQQTAAELTRALLPAELPPVPGYQAAARYLPAGSPVAGDWFDLFRLPSGRHVLGVGDAGGHGVPAASLMALLRNAARGLAISGSSPGWVLRALNLLTSAEGEDVFATAVYAALDPDSGAVVWASAGHLPPLLYREGAARFAGGPNHPPLGWPAAGPAPESTLYLGPGDALVLVTDGVVERRDRDITEGMEELRQVVAHHGDLGAEALTDRIVATIGPVPLDDCCVLVLRRAASAADDGSGAGPIFM